MSISWPNPIEIGKKLLSIPATVVEKGLDAMGMPEVVGDLASGAINLVAGNYQALFEDGLDLLNIDQKPITGTEPQPPKPSRAEAERAGDGAGAGEKTTPRMADRADKADKADKANKADKAGKPAKGEGAQAGARAADAKAPVGSTSTAQAGAAAGADGEQPIDWKQALADIRAGRNPEGLNLDPNELAMLRYQEETQRYNRMVTFLTQMLTVAHDTQKAVLTELRV